MRSIEAVDQTSIQNFLNQRWHSHIVELDGVGIDASRLPGFIDITDGMIAGLVTVLDGKTVCEIVTLDSVTKNSGMGTRLVENVIQRARELHMPCLVVRTTNDNLDALRFYQRRNFLIKNISIGAIDKERARDPSIPLIGRYGIPCRDEIMLSLDL